MYIIISIIIFGLLIATHELGHFLAAKASGVRVIEFAIGMGPAILKKQGKETLYTLRLFPIGGFCAMEGEDAESEDPRAFTNQPIWKRLIILTGGAAMNFIFGFLLILILYAQASYFRAPVISGFMEGCPYEGEAGFLEGDRFYKIDGERIYFSSNVTQIMSRNNTGYFDIVLIRGGNRIYLDQFKLEQREYTIEGETVFRYGLYFDFEDATILSRIKYSWYSALDYVRLVRFSLMDLVTGVFGIKELSGPVGIIGVMSEAGESAQTAGEAFSNILNLTAFIFINLAVMNMLPIPALDGGRVLFMGLTWVIEKISKRKLDPKYEGYIHAAGLILLLGLSVVVLYNDIVRIISA